MADNTRTESGSRPTTAYGPDHEQQRAVSPAADTSVVVNGESTGARSDAGTNGDHSLSRGEEGKEDQDDQGADAEGEAQTEVKVEAEVEAQAEVEAEVEAEEEADADTDIDIGRQPIEQSELTSEDHDVRIFETPDDELPPLPSESDDEELSLVDPAAVLQPGSPLTSDDASALLEQDTRRRLMDMESSFLPEQEVYEIPNKGADDTFLFGGSPGNTKRKEVVAAKGHQKNKRSIADLIRESVAAQTIKEEQLRSPTSPTTQLGEVTEEQSRESTATLDMPSSPAAEAARRSENRGAGKVDELEVDHELSDIETPVAHGHERQASQASTIRPEDASLSTEEEPSLAESTASTRSGDEALGMSSVSSRLLKRPSFLSRRQSSQRSSRSSYTAQSMTSEGSDNTIGADYALQSGGALPASGMTNPSTLMSRLPSFGSVSSAGESVTADSLGLTWRSRAAGELGRLDEERFSPPETPRPSTAGNSAPTDTVIAQHVRNIRVPETIAREYREKHASRSPNRIETGGSLASFRESRKGNLTLKEQNGKIDKLTKENFDLKLKIHFLDQALQNRSAEGVKEMINKNVQLQTDLANEKKEGQGLRKKIRELEQRLNSQEEVRNKPRPGSRHSDRSEKMADLEEDVILLRETIQEHEVEIERLREETMVKEIEKRKLADYVKVMSEERRSSEEHGVEETIDMWKDLLQAETARREQADEDTEKLRDELRRIKHEQATINNTHNVRNVYQISKRQNVSYGPRSEAGSAAGAGAEVNGDNRAVSAASTLVEQLKHENAELRRDLSAQTSMLTSRNRERERLQQEIEDLKLHNRRHAGDLSAVRSIAGDSIFERSVSRAHNRAESRLSGNTRVTQLSDAERDDFERRHASLRDEIAQIKMINQDLERELNAHLDILQNVEADNKALKEDKRLTMEDLTALQNERDEAVNIIDEQENELEKLRSEAEEEIETMRSQAVNEIDALEQELHVKTQDFDALQQEVQSISENVVRLEDELGASRQKEQQLEQQLEDTEAELERTISKLRDTQSKNERLEVQLESSQGEISFLREEQEADKIKIGELEAALNAAQTSLQDEQERIAEERRQREIVDTQEKADVQKILDELNEESNAYKDESKRLKKNLERKEAEASQWKERLETLETNLREALGDLNGTRSSILKDVTKLTRDLEHTLSALEHTRQELTESQRILRTRDGLLETAGIESRKLNDLLEKERAGRRADRNHFEQMQRSQQSLTHTIQQNDQRVSQIESTRRQERKKYEGLEQTLYSQLHDRNNLLLGLWNRLAGLCGADFIQRNALINDSLPSPDAIGRNLPAFSRNINLAIRTLEILINGFRTRIREVEKSLFKDFQTLEHAMDVRTKRIDHLEKMIEQQTRERLEAPSALSHHGLLHEKRSLSRTSSKSVSSRGEKDEVSKLKSENKMLKRELQFVQGRSPSREQKSLRDKEKGHATKGSMDSTASISGIIPPGMPGATRSPEPPGRSDIPRRGSSTRGSGRGLSRHHSASIVEGVSHGHSKNISRDALPGLNELGPASAGEVGDMAAPPSFPLTHASAQYPPSIPGGNIQPLPPHEQRWIHRLKELERRLKAEREARLLDRSGARKRIEEYRGETEELRLLLERERMMRRESGESDGIRGDEQLDGDDDVGYPHSRPRSSASANTMASAAAAASAPAAPGQQQQQQQQRGFRTSPIKRALSLRGRPISVRGLSGRSDVLPEGEERTRPATASVTGGGGGGGGGGGSSRSGTGGR